MVSNIVTQDYCCFLHPERKHSEYPDRCPDCKLPYDFPLTMPPKNIEGKIISEGLNRGFYGAVYKSDHPTILNRESAIKVIPKATYGPHEQGGYGKSFSTELQLYHVLSGIDLVATLYDAGESTISFGPHEIPCHWLEMEYVRGPLLKEVIEEGPANPRIIAQIASDLLDLIGQLQQREMYHNDLHGRNVKVVYLERDRARATAIEKNIQTKILDLGSVAEASRSDSGHWSDVHQVANHIFELTASYERKAGVLEPGEQRICARLRQIAQQWCAIDVDERRPKPNDLKLSLAAACMYGTEWWDQPIKLDSIGDYLNAAGMPSFRAQTLFSGPDYWKDTLLETGTKLLTGMRGCGKTMLLRSLHWNAKIYQYPGEDKSHVERRIGKDKFLALFISCATLLRGPRPAHTPELVMHRLFLAYVLELIHLLQTCDLRKIGNFDSVTCVRLNQLVKDTVPWYEEPSINTDLYETESSLIHAVNVIPSKTAEVIKFNPRQSFEDLTTIIRSWGDILKNKRILFLLDDVSMRYMSKESVEAILTHLCFQSEFFSFKVSTETQTLTLRSPGDKLAQIGRDYEIFDLGEEVFAILRDRKKRVEFIQSILYKRAQNTLNLEKHKQANPVNILGRRPFVQMGNDIRKSGGKTNKYYYYGLDALIGVCVGDLGEIINIYDRMLRHKTETVPQISNEHQHKELLDFSERRLRTLANSKPWLYAHAIAFAEASNRELMSSKPDRLRQYGEVNITIGIEDAEELFPKIRQMVEEGVFVATGATARKKSIKPRLQFKLAYRKLLGLTLRIPLSMRDRFELANEKLKEWVAEPKSSLLEYKKGNSGDDEHTEDEVEDENGKDAVESGVAITKRTKAGATQESLFRDIEVDSEQLLPTDLDSPKEQVVESQKRISPHVLFDVESREVKDDEFATLLESACVVGAIGFEDRSVGSWDNLTKINTPEFALLLRYPNQESLNAENESKLHALLDAAKIKADILDIEVVPEYDLYEELCTHLPEECVFIIDISSMTKSLIFTLLSNALRMQKQVYVLHTHASRYFPNDNTLKPLADSLMRALSDEDSTTYFKEKFDELDQLVTGEKGPYECVNIGKSYSDPSQPVFLAAIVSLKLEPVQTIFQQGEVEKSGIIYPVHSAGRRASRSVVARQLAEYLSQLYSGEPIGLKSFDHTAAFQALVDLHKRWALEDSFNFELALTGTKMHTVGAAMFAATVLPANVYYARVSSFDVKTFSSGTGKSKLVSLKRVEKRS